MKHRTLVLMTSALLTIALLAACGPKGDGSSSGAVSGGGASASQQPDGSLPDAGIPDVSAPDVSTPDASLPDPSVPAQLTLDKTDFSLFKVGDSYRLKVISGENSAVQWSSSNEKVAAVSEDGTVTAVSPGSVTITATAGDQTATCKVFCKLPVDSSSSSSSAAGQVDLSAFYQDITSRYEFSSFLELADGEILANLFPGLEAIDTQQCLVYVNMMSMNNGEFALVQVKDSKDVDAVKAILQARIDYMVDGGAWYPEPTEIWTNYSSVVSNGSYVMMVVNESCSSIVDEFNALFQ